MDLFELVLDENYIPEYSGFAYHYCTLDTLVSIIKNKTLRFSDIRYLNDTTEFTHAVDIYKKVCINKKRHFNQDFCDIINNANLLQDMSNFEQDYFIVEYKEHKNKDFIAHGSNKKCRLFVCCFSVAPDELGLWNYYGDNNSGCNLELDLQDILSKYSLGGYYKGGKVCYGDREKEEVIEKMLDNIYSAWQNDPYPYVNEIILSDFNVIRTFFKHKAFKNEQEFRIVLGLPIDTPENKNISFFIRDNLLVPYIDIPFNKDNMMGITLGPYINNEHNERSIIELLEKHQIKHATIHKSTIPLRPIG